MPNGSRQNESNAGRVSPNLAAARSRPLRTSDSMARPLRLWETSRSSRRCSKNGPASDVVGLYVSVPPWPSEPRAH